jgi:thiamine-phosphate pyrophosphorylase
MSAVIGEAVQNGADLIQLREKDLPSDELLDMAWELREVTQGKALLFVNGRVDIALAVGADGVHLPEEGLSVAAVRTVAESQLIIGRSVHSVRMAQCAEDEGVDFVLVGTIFKTVSKKGVLGMGLELVRNVASAVQIPVLSIGGINAENAQHVVKAGASGIAVIGAIMDAEHTGKATRVLQRAMEVAGSSKIQAMR